MFSVIAEKSQISFSQTCRTQVWTTCPLVVRWPRFGFPPESGITLAFCRRPRPPPSLTFLLLFLLTPATSRGPGLAQPLFPIHLTTGYGRDVALAPPFPNTVFLPSTYRSCSTLCVPCSEHVNPVSCPSDAENGRLPVSFYSHLSDNCACDRGPATDKTERQMFRMSLTWEAVCALRPSF